MIRVLITGAGGFIGRHLIDELASRGQFIRAFTRRAAGASFPEAVEIATGDIRDVEAVRAAVAGCDTVIHLAAKVHSLSSPVVDPEQESITLEGTRNVMRAAVAGGVKRFVFLSTLAVYGPSSSVQDEDSPVHPVTSYGRAKLDAERIVYDSAASSRMNVCILRPAMVYGHGAKGHLPRLVRAVARPVFGIPTGAENRRSVLHVRNLVEAIVLGATHPQATGKTYVVTDARHYSTAELVHLIARAVNRRAPIIRIPRMLLEVVARAGDLGGILFRRRLPFDRDALQKLTESHYFTSARITRELGYVPRWTLEDSIGDVARDLLKLGVRA